MYMDMTLYHNTMYILGHDIITQCRMYFDITLYHNAIYVLGHDIVP